MAHDLRLPGLAAILLALILASVLHLKLGATPLDWRDVWGSLFAPVPGDARQTIVRDMRLPRLVSALMVGGCLGLAGALMQAIAENPLAEPGLLGINSGAAFFVVAGYVVMPHHMAFTLPLLACLGAVTASACVLAYVGSDPDPGRLVLSGVMVGALFSALTLALLLLDQQGLETSRRWLVGSLAYETSATRRQVLPFLLLAILVAVIAIPGLNLLRLGARSASLLGLNVGRTRLVMLAAIVVLAGSAVAIAGPIGFVGLVAPHVVRLLFGEDYRYLVPLSPLCGALLMVVGDIAARSLVSPFELNTGIVTALIGSPLFILLVLRRVR